MTNFRVNFRFQKETGKQIIQHGDIAAKNEEEAKKKAPKEFDTPKYRKNATGKFTIVSVEQW